MYVQERETRKISQGLCFKTRNGLELQDHNRPLATEANKKGMIF